MSCLPVPGVALSPASAQKSVASVHKSELHLMLQRFSPVPKLTGVTPASRLEARPAPTMVTSGISEIDDLTGGLPQGCLSEVCGPASSGRTSLLIAALAAATRRQEVCALVDTTNAFDPLSAAAAGVNFERLLWIRCGTTHDTEQNACHAERDRSFAKRSPGRVEASLLRSRSTTGIGISRSARNDNSQNEVEQALRVTDLLLQSGGFGLVAIDLGDVPFPMARRIPLTSWFRFQRAVENTPTVLLVVAQAPCAQTCATLLVRLEKKLSAFSSQPSRESRAEPAHAQLFKGMQIEGELLRSRMERKPAASVDAAFTTKAAWAG
jgi:hypothetical protein